MIFLYKKNKHSKFYNKRKHVKKKKNDKGFHSVNNICSDNFDIFDRPVLSAGLHHPYSVQNGDSFRNSSKNAVLSIQPLSRCQRKKELAAVCIWSSVGHCQNTSTWQTNIQMGRLSVSMCFCCGFMQNINAFK